MEFLCQKTPYHAVSINALKGIAERSRAKMARFVVDFNGIWHGGDSEFLTHWCLTYNEYDRVITQGYVYFEKDHFSYICENSCMNVSSERLESYGIIKRPEDERGEGIHPSQDDLGIDRRYTVW